MKVKRKEIERRDGRGEREKCRSPSWLGEDIQDVVAWTGTFSNFFEGRKVPYKRE